MTTISAEVICDSVSDTDSRHRITTMRLVYPRFVHSEFMTHRVFSRNASSSRAIPVRRMISNIRRDPAMPVHWGSNKPGMQAGEEVTGARLLAMKALWLGGMWIMTTLALVAARLGVHKQVVNRMVEPWSHIMVVVTSTEWANFFKLRRHADADPTMQALAEAMWVALLKSRPQTLSRGQYHLPFITSDEVVALYAQPPIQVNQTLVMMSAARCARTSYWNFDGKPASRADDERLCEKLLTSPIHASPFEHQAQLIGDGEFHGPLRGWKSYRMELPDENTFGYPPESYWD